jgi:hypothetical protein
MYWIYVDNKNNSDKSTFLIDTDMQLKITRRRRDDSYVRVWLPINHVIDSDSPVLRTGYIQMLSDSECIYYPTHDCLYQLLNSNSWSTQQLLVLSLVPKLG